MRNLTLALVSVCLLLTACGSGTRLEIANDTGLDFLVLSITIDGEELSWTDIPHEDTVSGSLAIQSTGTAPVAKICWDNGIDSYEGEVILVDSASAASKIQILISTDATFLNYSF